jgi:hypothetical protein
METGTLAGIGDWVEEPLVWLEQRAPVHLGLEQALLTMSETERWRLSSCQTSRGVSAVAFYGPQRRWFLEASDALGALSVFAGTEQGGAQHLIATEGSAQCLGSLLNERPQWVRHRRTLTGLVLSKARTRPLGRMATRDDLPMLAALELPALVQPAQPRPDWGALVASSSVIVHLKGEQMGAVLVTGVETRRCRSVEQLFTAAGPEGKQLAAGLVSYLSASPSPKTVHVSLDLDAHEAQEWATDCGFSRTGLAYDYEMAMGK